MTRVRLLAAVLAACLAVSSSVLAVCELFCASDCARSAALAVLAVLAVGASSLAVAQTPPEHVHEHAMTPESMAAPSGHPSAPLEPDTMHTMLEMDPGEGWMTMFHGFAFLTFNRQSGAS